MAQASALAHNVTLQCHFLGPGPGLTRWTASRTPSRTSNKLLGAHCVQCGKDQRVAMLSQHLTRRSVNRRRRRRLSGVACTAEPTAQIDEVLELPCLPFPPNEVFVPGGTKSLHLYEARFLAFLDAVLSQHDKLFAHIVVEPLMVPARDQLPGGNMASYVASFACLGKVVKVRRLDVGALVTVRGLGRIKLQKLTQMEPYLKGQVVLVKDIPVDDPVHLSEAATKLEDLLRDVQHLSTKLKSSLPGLLGDPGEIGAIQTIETNMPLTRALGWVDSLEEDGGASVEEPFKLSREERLSFAALQPTPGASARELHKLLQRRLLAMECTSTSKRLREVTEYVEEIRSSLAAKVALQSLSL